MKESDHRYGAEMQLVLDVHVKAVVEFMQSNIPTAKLIGVAESLPKIGRLLWDGYEQEPFDASRMQWPSATTVAGQLRSTANESSPEQCCAHDDSAAVVGA
jgi:hypothetical protein